MLWPKRNSYKECDNEKKSCGSNIPHPKIPKEPSVIQQYAINYEDDEKAPVVCLIYLSDG